MDNRVIFFLLFFSLSFSVFAADIQKIKVKTIGKQNVSNYIFRDFSFGREFENLPLSEQDVLGLSLFYAFKTEYDVKKSKRIIDSITAADLRTHLIRELLSAAAERSLLPEFGAFFKEYLADGKNQGARMFLALLENSIEKDAFDAPEYKAFAAAYMLYKDGMFKDATETIKPFKKHFPRTFYVYLMEAGAFKDACDFIEGVSLKDGRFLKAAALYFMQDYNGAVKILNGKDLSYEEKLLLIDGKIKLGIDDGLENELESQPLPLFIRDDFWIFRSFESLNLASKPHISEQYKSFFYRWKLRHYAQYLNLYRDEIERFAGRLKEMERRINMLESEYGKIWGKIEGLEEAKELRQRMLSLADMMKSIKKADVSFAEGGREMFDYFQREYEKGLDNLKNVYEAYAGKLLEESENLKTELAARRFERQLAGIKKLDAAEFTRLFADVKNLHASAVKKGLSFEEAAGYWKVFLLWEYYLKGDGKDFQEKEKTLKDVVTEADGYLKKYGQNKKEALLILAEALEGLGDSGGALNAYKQYFSLNPDAEDRVYMKVGEILFEKRDYENAAGYFKKAAEKPGVYLNAAYYKIGWCYYLTGRLDEVADLFLGYNFQSFSGKTELLLDEMLDLLSRTFYKMDDEAKTESYLRKYPGFPFPDRLYRHVGDIYLFLANYQKALGVYEKGLAEYYLYQNSHQLLTAKVEVYAMTGRETDSNREKMRFADMFGKESEYFKRHGAFPANYKDFALSAGFFFNAAYDKNKDGYLYDASRKLYEIFLESFSSEPKAGEVAFLLGQLKEDKWEYRSAGALFEKAKTLNFREEESLYKQLYCDYKLWQEKAVDSGELIKSLKSYVSVYPQSERSLSVYMVLADMTLKEKRFEDMFLSLEGAAGLPGGNGIKKALDFAETNFGLIDDKGRLAALFEKGWKFFGNRHYLGMKHYSIFTAAKKSEDMNDFITAKGLYKNVIDDRNSSEFKDFAVFNLALILQKEGQVKEAVDAMRGVKEKDDLKYKAKRFIYIFGKKEGLHRSAAQAAEELAKELPDEKAAYLLEAAWLYFKGKDMPSAGRVASGLKNTALTGGEKRDYEILKGISHYHKGDFISAYESFVGLLSGNIREDWEADVNLYFYEVMKKAVFTRPEEEARDTLEQYIDLLGRQFKEKGDPVYLYHIGEALTDFSVFFIQKDEAVSRAKEILKKSLFKAVEKGDEALTVKVAAKLLEVLPEIYKRDFTIPPIEIKFEDMVADESILD